MDSSQYGTSDVIWKKRDDGTFELSNVIPPMPPPDLPATPALTNEVQRGLQDMSPAEQANYIRGMSLRQHTGMTEEGRHAEMMAAPQPSVADEANARRQQQLAARQQLRNYDKLLKRGASHDQVMGGFQELIESGAMWVDENGDLFGAVPSLEGRRKRVLEASQEWSRMQNQFSNAFEQAGIPHDDQSREAQARRQEIINRITGWGNMGELP